MSTEADSRFLERGPQLPPIVDLAVVTEDPSSVPGYHRLVSRRRKVQNREATMTKSDAGIRIQPLAFVVRAAVTHRFKHVSKCCLCFPRESRGDPESGYSTH